jgi:flavin-dependent dehydrogenase
MGTELDSSYDVAILGGGLAGLTLARQLRLARPETRIFVAEKRPGPAPEAAFKVGESTVELAADYFGEKLELKEDLEVNHLHKMSLRYFYTAGDNSDLAQRVEFGTPFSPPVPSYQLDRGRFENELSRRARKDGIDLVQGAFVDEIELGPDQHQVTIVQGGPGGTRTVVQARWLVDAAGRAFLLKRKLGLEEQNDHRINSSWFRLAGGIDYEKWVEDDDEWLERVPTRGLRRLATTHLMGEGYWVWLIPLSSGPVSIGIVADPRFHPYEEIRTLDGALDWLRRHEPQLAAEVSARRDQVEDFLTIEDFSYGCKQVYSGEERWALVGEAGPFLDPFYSPGSDYIAMGNTLATDLIVRSLAGEDVAERAKAHNDFFLAAYELTLTWYLDQYGLFGDPQIGIIKVGANNLAYWSTTASLMCHGKLADLEFREAVMPEIERIWQLSRRIEALLRDWHEAVPHTYERAYVHTNWFPAMGLRHVQLHLPLDDEALKAKATEDRKAMEALAVAIFHQAAGELKGEPLDHDLRINPYAVGLRPERWDEDGVFDASGLTLEEAHRIAIGVENYWLDHPPSPELGPRPPDLRVLFAQRA